ncbi:MAG: NAD(P)-binding domain-containing protein [Burkholderiaceae bacterium]
MKVTVIGAGNMGSAFVKQLTGAGHQVRVVGHDLEQANRLAAAHPGATAVVPDGAAKGVDVVVLATGAAQAIDALRGLGDLQGAVVIDITNPLTADFMGLTIGHQSSSAEEIARAVPAAEIVKGFNTVFAQVLAEGASFGNDRRVSVFMASDSARAKGVATELAQSMGFEVIDAGGLVNARYLEPLAGLNIYLGYGAGWGTAIAPTWIRKG